VNAFSRDERTSWLFPGQGAHRVDMLDAFRKLPGFTDSCEQVSEVLGFDVTTGLSRLEPNTLNANKTSSLLIILCSVLARQGLEETPSVLAGYSVGQWTALHVAGGLDFSSLLRVVVNRAEIMDRCFHSKKGAMLGVVGIKEVEIREVVEVLQNADHAIGISNYNSLGQYSLAGSEEAISLAQDRLETLSVRKVVRLDVAGAWHSCMLQPAVEPFREFLETVELKSPNCTVIDNVTALPLPEASGLLKDQLAAHLAAPVQWHHSVKWLAEQGIQKFLEVGYGDMLTKFGFFSARDSEHLALYPSPRLARPTVVC
jgi:[acyl-carrier-protein] S-malonyltransferase